MKSYIADIFTFTRFCLAVSLFVFTIIGADSGTACFVFALGELTDAFDGTAASRWPFPKGKSPRYRKYASKYDIITDTLLSVGMILFFIVRVNLVAGLIIGIGFSALAIVTDLIVYGKLFGHPDDFKPNSLAARNFPLARRIVLTRRAIYITLIGIVATWSLLASSFPSVVKITTLIIAAFIGVFLWFFLSQRRHNISRDAVDIEKKLTKTIKSSQHSRDRRA